MPAEVAYILARFDQAVAERAAYEQDWQDVADFILPGHAINETNIGFRAPRRRRTLYDDTAVDACKSLAAAVHALLSNPTERWFGLAMLDERGDRAAEEWLYQVTTILIHFFESTRSGFATASYELYLMLAGFGQGVALPEEDHHGLSISAKPLSDFYFCVDSRGRITETHRVFEMTAAEAYERFGSELSAQTIRAALDPARRYTVKVGFIHSIMRRMERDADKMDAANMPWQSTYIEREAKSLASESGFRRMRYLAPRWSVEAGSAYGSGPGVDAIPSARCLNVMTYTVLTAGELLVRPPINVPAGGLRGPLRTAPGAVNYYQRGIKEYAHAMNLGARPMEGLQLVELWRSNIERKFFLDRLQLPERDRMTATEIIARRQEGLMAASPILSRLYAEWLEPVIMRALDWHHRRGLLPPAPESIRGRFMRINYTSPMARSQRASEGQAFALGMSQIEGLLAADQQVIARNLDVDDTFRALMVQAGINPKRLRTPEQVEAIRQEMNEKAEMESAARTARDAAPMVKAMTPGRGGDIR